MKIMIGRLRRPPRSVTRFKRLKKLMSKLTIMCPVKMAQTKLQTLLLTSGKMSLTILKRLSTHITHLSLRKRTVNAPNLTSKPKAKTTLTSAGL
jgi:hypothetical protein